MSSDLDWDDDEFEPQSVAQTAQRWNEDEEEEEEEEEENEERKIEKKKKPIEKKKPKAQEYVDETLSDPIEEKLRQQRLVEAEDLRAAMELFGTEEDFKDFDCS